MIQKGVLFGLCLLGMFEPVLGQEKVTLRLVYPEGRTVRYKNKHSFYYFSDKGEIILVSGSFDARHYGEWQSREVVIPVEGDETGVRIVASISKGGSQGTLLGNRLSYEDFPFTLDMLNDRKFSWHVSSEGHIDRFDPDFPAYKIERQDMITDLYQCWVPGMAPVLPGGPVGKGDTWQGEQTFERRFASMDVGGKCVMQFTSTYKVKKIKKKKGRTIVEIDEDRKVRYRGWFHIEALSLMIDGEGSGNADWEIDVDRGLMLSHKMKIGIGEPQVTMSGQMDPIEGIHAEIELVFSRKLDKVEKE